MALSIKHQSVRVRGTVQGVGFRPMVFRLAIENRLKGVVLNDTDGVLIHLSGRDESIKYFVERLESEVPPLAKIDGIEVTDTNDPQQYSDFSILSSLGKQGGTEGRTEVSADAAICQLCIDEISDGEARRYRYPFTNCTHCGPRLSIIRSIPYDRSNTTMVDFPLCASCKEEYSNPCDRRFHAQPIACHKCGPSLSMHRYNGSNDMVDAAFSKNSETSTDHIFKQLNVTLNKGEIVAIKGLGGFHLCCDASNPEAVKRLRKRKRRYAKPLALMCDDKKVIQRYCHLSSLEEAALSSPAAPIVLLKKRSSINNELNALSKDISPDTDLIGFMLPHTPLHKLICQQFKTPLVMTSGNLSGEPQIINNVDAIEKLEHIADLIVYHNRTIANRIDDSVIRYISGRARVIRRARGYAPRSIPLPKGFELSDNILAYGAALKSTFCLITKGTAILSQHQGDLESLTTYDDYEKNINLYQSLFEFEPTHIVYDLHPEYLSTKLAKKTAKDNALTSSGVQHHHAHIASVMVENLIPISHPRLLGIALDGLGFGDDNALWGGEFLLADYSYAERLASFASIAMPGGTQSIKQPWRNTFAHIANSMSWIDFQTRYSDIALAKFFNEKPISTLQAMLDSKLNCPKASSTGRLFDAIAGALNINAEQVFFEGQAAVALEMLADDKAILKGDVEQPYIFDVVRSQSQPRLGSIVTLDAASIWPFLLNDLKNGVSNKIISTRFHAGLIDGIVRVVDILHQQHDFTAIALSGGCLQNAILLQGLEQAFSQRQLRCLTHSIVPANDGGIALGQASIAAARNIKATQQGQPHKPESVNQTYLSNR